MKRLILLAPIALSACGPDRVEAIPPPPALLTCAEEPRAPDLPGRDQQDVRDALVLDYILALRSAWADCASKVAGMKAWADGISR